MQRAHDFDLLPDGKIQITHFATRVDIAKPVLLQYISRHFLAAPAPDNSKRAGGLVGQQHVLRDRERADQRNFLERGLNAPAVRFLGLANSHHLVEEANFPTVGPIETV